MSRGRWTERALHVYADVDSAAKTDEIRPDAGVSSVLAALSPSAYRNSTARTSAGAQAGPLVEVRWSPSARGYLAVRDPSDGSWHEIAYRDAPEVWHMAVRRSVP